MLTAGGLKHPYIIYFAISAWLFSSWLAFLQMDHDVLVKISLPDKQIIVGTIEHSQVKIEPHFTGSTYRPQTRIN